MAVVCPRATQLAIFSSLQYKGGSTIIFELHKMVTVVANKIICYTAEYNSMNVQKHGLS